MKLMLMLASVLLVQSAQDVPPFVAPGTRIIAGQVLAAEGGDPAVGVSVAAFPLPEGNTVIPPGEARIVGVAQTDSFGKYRLNVPVALRQRPYLIAVGTFNPSIAEQLVARVTGFSSDVQTMETPRAQFKVRGRVTRRDSANPDVLSKTEVRLSARNSVTLIAKPGPEGSFEFMGIPPGSYSLRITPDASMDAVPVIVTDKDIDGLEMVVPPKVRITGTATVEGAPAPLPTIRLTFWQAGGRSPSQITVNVDREFALQLPPEPRRITISGLPAGYSIKSLTLQSSSGAGAIDLMPLVRSQEAIPLNAGDSVRVALTLSASPGAGVKVSGRVTNPRGSRIESSTVRISGMAIAENRDLTPVREAAARGVALTNPDIAGQLEVAVSADGSFEFSTVPPGTYDLTVPGNSWASSRQVIVGAEDVTNVVIEAPPTKVVPGQLVIEGVAGIPFDDKWPIWISVGSGNSVGSGSVLGTRGAGDGLIAPNGSFTIRVPEKEHQIRVTLGSPGYAVKAVEYGKTDVLKNPVKLDSSPAELLRITLAPVRTFVVPVIFHRGQPARLGTPQIGPSGLTEPSGVTAPELLRAVAPQYSEARINAIGTANLAFTGPAAFVDTPGSLWLDATIQHDGTVVPNGNLKTGARGNSSADPLIQAIQKSEFKPATKNGAPTDARVQIEMRGVVE